MHGRGTAAIQTGALRWKRDGDSHFPGRSFAPELQGEDTFFFRKSPKECFVAVVVVFFSHFAASQKNLMEKKFVEIDKSAFSPV